MNRRPWMLIGLLAMTVVVGSAQTKPDGPAVGMITKSGGEVFIQRGAARSPARVAESLYAGDRVDSSAGSVEFIFCPSSEKVVVEKGTTVSLDKEKVQVVRGNAPKKIATRCSLPKVALGAESMEHIGGLRPRGQPPITLYFGGPVSRTRPSIDWAAISGAESYRVTIRNPETNAVIWDSRTNTTTIVYPESTSPLEKREYSLEVRAEASSKIIAEGFVNFEVKPDSGSSTVAGEGLDARLLRAIELENAGYLAEAAADYRAVRDANAGDQRLTRRLIWLYWNAGLIAASNEEQKKLKSEPPK